MEPSQSSQENSQISLQGETSRSNRPVDRRVMPSQNSIHFREIHKNAWLKELPPADKKPGACVKKAERVWVVFCVHDDVAAFLEIYPDQRVAGSHRPEKSFFLGGCRHVSPTICAQDDSGEFEFVINLPTEHVRLIAPTWDIMTEWVETIQAKLREMKILSPKENIYSKMPEFRTPPGPLAPTRDPNSPLPPRPSGSSATTAGLESRSTPLSAPAVTESDVERENIFFPQRSSQGDSVILRNSATTSLFITQSEPPIYSRPHRTLCRASSSPGPEIVESNSIPATPNVTIIEVSAATSENTQPSPTNRPPVVLDSGSTVIFTFNQMESALSSVGEDSENRNSSPVTTTNDYDRPTGLHSDSPQIISNPSPISSITSTTTLEVPGYASTSVPSPSRPSLLTSCIGGLSRQPAISRSQFYDLPEGREDAGVTEHRDNPPTVSRSQFYDSPESRDSISVERCSESGEGGSEPGQDGYSNLYERVYVPLSFPPRGRAVREVSEEEGNGTRAAMEGETPPPCVINKGNSRGKQGPVGDHSGNSSERRLLPPPRPHQQNVPEANLAPGGSGNRLTLREEQVKQLREQISRPEGVRLCLEREDCVGVIALVDALQSVWVAGWKQRQRPMLYNFLHFGDQLLSVCGKRVLKSADAERLIQGAGAYVELLIRRLPFGSVFAIQRDTTSGSGSTNSVKGLGLVLEGGTAQVRSVEPGGPAARAGLSQYSPSADGLSICPWVLTEVNSRPLNPFFRDGEPATRLGAVGGEVSILVQPSDLVWRLIKKLKAMRNYKDYIVQCT